MSRRLVLVPGELIPLNRGSSTLKYIEDVPPKVYASKARLRRVKVQCQCGESFKCLLGSIRAGKTTSCGCFHKSQLRRRLTTHGKTDHPLYTRWVLIRRRCNNPKARDYAHYGGRGIKLSPEWVDDPIGFIKHCESLPSYIEADLKNLTVDRVDNDLGYIPGNLRFVTQAEQLRNTRRNRYLTLGGETLCVAEWARRLDTSSSAVLGRLDKLGWTLEQALTTPVGQKRKIK